jgi:hypothetical protein
MPDPLETRNAGRWQFFRGFTRPAGERVRDDAAAIPTPGKLGIADAGALPGGR